MSSYTPYFTGITLFDDEYCWEEDEEHSTIEEGGEEVEEENGTRYKARIAKGFIIDNCIDFLAFLADIKQRYVSRSYIDTLLSK